VTSGLPDTGLTRVSFRNIELSLPPIGEVLSLKNGGPELVVPRSRELRRKFAHLPAQLSLTYKYFATRPGSPLIGFVLILDTVIR